jgi:large repetitive protein
MTSILTWAKRRKSIAAAVALVVIAGVPLTIAVLHRGFPVNDVNLGSRDVWVTNGDKLQAGRLNHQIDQLDAAVSGQSTKLDVLQDGGAYFLTDTSHGSVERISSSYVTLTDRITVPDGSQVAYGKNTLAILAPTGSLWVLDASGHLDFDSTKTHTDAKLGKGAKVTVSTSGVVFAVSPSEKKLVTVDHPNAAVQSADFRMPSSTFQLSAVGDQPVVLDGDGRHLQKSDGSSIELPQKGLALQQASAASAAALVASGTGLMEVPLGGGSVTPITAHGASPVTNAAQVSAPVQLDGCDYGAWAGSGRYLYACDGKKPISQNIGEPVSGDDLEFRVNHGVIALNNLRNGDAWVVSSHMQLVQNWAQLKPNQTEVKGTTGQKKPVLKSYADTLAQRTSVNRPPIALDDNFGVRPGRTTLLPVLDNDTDPDGDVITITGRPQVPASQGRIDVINGGRALQFTPAPAINGTVSFRYSIDDGRGGTASAQVNASIHPLSVNAAPAATRASTATAEVGQSVSYDVLQDWIDPDGDDPYLVSATPTTQDGVQFTPDGYVTFKSLTGQTGSKEVDFQVSDGHLTASGTLLVTVKPQGTLDPIAVPDFASVLIGEPQVIHPLDNDLSPSGDPLTLVGAKLSSSGNMAFTVDQAHGTVTVNPHTVGEFYLTYTEGAGSHSTTGLIRVNTSSPDTGSAPPIAVKDTAYVRAGESTTVDVLDNDVSPSGRVLGVRSVTKGADADALNVEVLDNTVVKITAPTVLDNQVQLVYTVSDGTGSATAAITVVPIAPLVNHQPPVAVDDVATVRAGDISTVDVLANDYSPDNEPFTLDPTLISAANAGGGATAFVSGSAVRYEAPKQAGQYTVTYGITDRFNQHAQAQVTFVVTPLAATGDRSPQPGALTLRTFAGTSIPVNVPLDGIDPDGDSVTLVGVASQPSLGRISATSSTGFSYEAYPASAGTDSFSYIVKDTYGKTATGSVKIGVIQRPSTVAPPIAVNDTVQVKPGKTAAVPVLANDSDPNGFTIALSKKLASVDRGLTAFVHGTIVLVKAPIQQGVFVARYTITNGHGGTASAYVQVIVTPSAKPQYPTAIDHVVEPEQVAAKHSVTVSALDGATNPSGLVGDLKVAVLGQNASSAQVGSGGQITITPGSSRMVVTYSATDPTTGLAADAFIIVPPFGDSTAPPHIKAGIGDQIVTMNGTKTWTLSEIVDVPSGRPIKLSGRSGVSATNSNGSSPYIDPQSIRFTGATAYRGPAAITFNVNDGHDPGQTKDRITSLVLPITVGNPDQTDVPPTFTPPHVSLQPGEQPTTIDLRDSSYHPNPAVLARLTYGNLSPSTSGGIQASLSGSKLTLTAPLGVQTGAVGTFHFTVSSGTLTIQGSATATVVSSTRPIASQLNPPQTAEIQRGKSTTLSGATGTQYWANPFPGQPLTITQASAVSAPAGVAVSHTGSSITVSASSGASIGTVNVTYQVEDATKDPKRTAQTIGRFQVTIHDVPSTPAPPSGVAAGDASASMSIAAPAANGKTIDEYQIAWKAGGGGTKTVTSVGKVSVTGLTNGTAYSFTVRAHNADGWSAYSASSSTVTPYGTPSAPAGAHLANNGTYANTTLQMTWDKLTGVAQTGGGTITYEYNFDNQGWKSAKSATSVKSPSVGAGTYSFQVRATNTGNKTSTVSTSNSITVSNAPPPDPTVTISEQGAADYSGGCSPYGCYHYHVAVKDFKPGKYTVSYECNGGGNPTDSITVGSDGTGSENSASGSGFDCGYTTYATVNGVKSNTENFKP